MHAVQRLPQITERQVGVLTQAAELLPEGRLRRVIGHLGVVRVVHRPQPLPVVVSAVVGVWSTSGRFGRDREKQW